MKIETQKEALSAIRNAAELAAVQGPWLGAIIHLVEGELTINRVTWQFPKEKMDEAVEMLRANLAHEKADADTLSDAPLPAAVLPQTIPMKPLEEQVCECPPQPEEQQEVPATPDDPDAQIQAAQEKVFGNGIHPNVQVLKVPATPDDLDGEVSVDVSSLPNANANADDVWGI